LIRKRQRRARLNDKVGQGLRSFENQGVPINRDDCFQSECNEVSGVFLQRLCIEFTPCSQALKIKQNILSRRDFIIPGLSQTGINACLLPFYPWRDVFATHPIIFPNNRYISGLQTLPATGRAPGYIAPISSPGGTYW